MVVDAKFARRKWLQKLLTAQGHKVTIATQGFAALTKLRRYKYDLLLTDTKMPCLTGPELVAELQERGIKIHIIGMSSRPECEKYYEYFWCKKEPSQKLLDLIKQVTAKPLN